MNKILSRDLIENPRWQKVQIFDDEYHFFGKKEKIVTNIQVLNGKSININIKIEAICTSETWKIQRRLNHKSHEW